MPCSLLSIGALLVAGVAASFPASAQAQWVSRYRPDAGYYYGSGHFVPDYYPGSRTYFGTVTPLQFPGGLGYEYNYPGGYHEIYPHGPYERFGPHPHPHSALQVGPDRYEYWH